MRPIVLIDGKWKPYRESMRVDMFAPFDPSYSMSHPRPDAVTLYLDDQDFEVKSDYALSLRRSGRELLEFELARSDES